MERRSRGLNEDTNPAETTFHILRLTVCWKKFSLTTDRVEKLLTQYLKKELQKKKNILIPPFLYYHDPLLREMVRNRKPVEHFFLNDGFTA